MDAAVAAQNRQLLFRLLTVAVVMLGFGFALVPLYRQICESLGITQSRVVAPANTQVDRSRMVRVEMVASSGGLPWRFEALTREVRLNPGELVTVNYRVVNTLGRPVAATAVMNAAPSVANQFIEKQECFCFSSQQLAAGEERVMPVVFRVSPKLPRDMDVVTLSYTFFEQKAAQS